MSGYYSLTMKNAVIVPSMKARNRKGVAIPKKGN
jgi:hypothetical protein